MGLAAKLADMKILLIDDDEWIRDSLGLFFELEKCIFLALESAEEGLEELKKQDYDIIILDYRLPGMDGLEFLKQIQETQTHAIKILITAFGSKEVFSEAIELGVHDFIDKPFSTEAIEDSLLRLTEEREQKNG
jgi:DNA-binding NtrC family response regulator